jgi:hypothetical protein
VRFDTAPPFAFTRPPFLAGPTNEIALQARLYPDRADGRGGHHRDPGRAHVVRAHRSKEKEADILLSQIYRLQEVYQVQYGVPAGTVTDLAKVGFETPTLSYYTWADNIAIPQCLSAAGAWKSRGIDADGNIDDCTP